MNNQYAYRNPLARWTLAGVGWGLVALTAANLLLTLLLSGGVHQTEAMVLGFLGWALAGVGAWFTYSLARHLGWTPLGAGFAAATSAFLLPLTTLIAVALWIKRSGDARRATLAQQQMDAQFQQQQMSAWQHESADVHAASTAAALQGSAGGGDPGTRFRSQ